MCPGSWPQRSLQKSEPLWFPQEASAPHQFEEVVVTRPLHFHAIANATGIPFSELRLLNPSFVVTRRRPATMRICSKCQSERKPRWNSSSIASPPIIPPGGETSICVGRLSLVQSSRGGHLEKVSRRFRIPLKTLKTRNNLTGPTIRPGDFLVISR